MGILRKLPEGFGAGELGDGVADSTTSATFAAPGKDAASSPPVAARNCLRSMSEPLRCFFMRLLDKRNNGVSPIFPPHYTSLGRTNKQRKSFFYWIQLDCARRRGTRKSGSFQTEQLPATAGGESMMSGE